MKVFVSRSLSQNSPLLVNTAALQIQWTYQSLIDFRKIDFKLPESDWLFFYSAKGVEFFHSGLTSEELHSIRNRKFGCYGPATANTFKEIFGFSTDYVGTGNAARDVDEFIRVTDNKKIVFIQAKNSKNAIQKLLTEETQYTSLEVYENSGRKSVQLGNFDFAILTSPLNAQTFHTSGGRAEYYIAIGDTTASAIRELTDADVHIANEPSELAMADLFLRLVA